MSLPELSSLADQISADPVPSPDNDNSNSKDQHFESRCNPEPMGNAAPIAFGGCTIAIAVHSAFRTLPTPPPNTPQRYHLYSVLGTFHGPTRIDRKLHTTVTTTRSTKTFQTRRVLASQLQDDNTTRTCADFFIDFHIEEPPFLTYNPTPRNLTILPNGPSHPTQTASAEQLLETLKSAGHITQAHADGFRGMFRMSEAYVETRHCKAGVSGNNLLGLAPKVKTDQDHLTIPQKTSWEWIRTRPSTVLTDSALNLSALSFFMDQALSFLPLNHDHKGFSDAGACSTLEFAFRVFVPDVKMSDWHLRERKAVVAGMGRTFAESRLWDEKGSLVCSSTQTCILRPPVQKGKVKPNAKGGSKI